MKKEEPIRICLTGGATGGHFFPLVFIVRELKDLLAKEGKNFEIFYLGSKPFKEELLTNEGVKIYLLPEVKLRRYFSFQNIIDLFKLPYALILALYYLFRLMPNLVFSKGGPSSLIVVLAARFYRLPVFIHDSDSIPGLSNKISGFFAKKVFLAFDSAQKYFKTKKTIVVGQPIDRTILEFKPTMEDYQRFDLDPRRKIITVLGGSQGSKFLNDLIVECLPELVKLAQIVHQTGEKNYEDVYLYAKGLLITKNPDGLKDYHPFPFIPHDDLIYLLNLSDLVIARAGSGTIFELAALGKPSILIPIDEKVVGLHQVMNARVYAHYGACFVIEEGNAKPHLLIDTIRDLINNDSALRRMKEAALSFAKPDASFKIAVEIAKFLQ